jgi:hypothetical protein
VVLDLSSIPSEEGIVDLSRVYEEPEHLGWVDTIWRWCMESVSRLLPIWEKLDESIGDKLRTKREAFPEDEISGYQEASMSADYYDRVKPIREQTKPASDG